MPPKSKEKENNQHIQVAVRCRPLNGLEKKSGSYNVVDLDLEKKEVRARERLVATAGTKSYCYDHVFGPRSSQMDVYSKMVAPTLDEVIMGYNCTIFAYGQTGTGKTHTMEGARADDGVRWDLDPEAGVIPRAMSHLFNLLSNQGCEYSVRVSYLEIYNEELIDLLGADSVDNPRLKIYEDSKSKGSCVIQGLEEAVVYNRCEVHQILQAGAAKRQTAATLMNSHSSRSHSLFMVTVHMKENSLDGEELLKTGKLNLVDLAGSECIGRSGAVEKRAREAGNINQSLLTLGRVITALVEHAPHVPYRESKLTRLLQDSLGGKTKTSIIATISPASCNLEETLSTLDYAFRAKNITNRPEINQKMSKKAHLKEMGDEIERLRRDLQAARDKNGIYLAEEHYNGMQTSLLQQRDEIKELDERLASVQADLVKTTELFSLTKDELAMTSQCLQETRDLLDGTKATLRCTVQQRDEQQFLVKKQVETEKELFSQANQLLTTSDLTTGHIGGLHEKIDRKRKVEEDNAQAKDRLKERFSTNISVMEQTLMGFTEQHLEQLTKVKQDLGVFLDDKTGKLAESKERLERFSAQITQNKCELDELVEEACCNKRQWSSDAATAAKTDKESTVAMVHGFRETFSSEAGKLNDTLAEISTLQQSIKDALTTHLSGIEQGMKSLVAQQMAALNHQRSLVEELGTQQTDTLNAHTQDVCRVTSQHTADVQGVADQLIGIINNLVHSQQNHASQVNTLCELPKAKKQIETFTHEADSNMRGMVSSLEDHSATLTTTCSKNTEETHQLVVTVDKWVEEAGQLHRTMDDHVKSFSHTAVQEAEDHEKRSASRLTQLQTAVTQHQHALNAHVDDVSKASHKAITDISNELSNQHCESKAFVQSQEGLLADASKQVIDWSMISQEQLSRRNAEVKKFVEDEMLVDISTGQTPKRQDYSYPQHLTQTGRHSLLLDAFRLDYSLDENDVAPPSLPNGLHPAQECDGSTGAMEDDDCANTSSDSAFSVASTLSSACSMEKLCENKENRLMGPPHAPKTTSTKTSRFGTPDSSNKSKKGPSKGSKAADSRTKSRVPMKTNN